jgi:hypothetical protein
MVVTRQVLPRLRRAPARARVAEVQRRLVRDGRGEDEPIDEALIAGKLANH